MWSHDAVLYQIDPSLFLDTNGDGRGDLRGIERQLEYVRSLGVSTIWLLPFYCSPFRDGGYDVTDHLAIDPRFGDVADFSILMERAESLGLRVLVELVMQHTSDQHPWFQQARRDRRSRYRDYYIWSDEPVDDGLKPIFPDVEDSVWSWDEEAGQFYRHMFYSHEPDLNIANPNVREEIHRIMGYWLRLGVAGFRIDAVPYMVERARVANPEHDGLWLLNDMYKFAWKRVPGAILMGEADVAVHKYTEYVGNRDRLTHLLDFWTNNHLFLALARERAKPLEDALHRDHDPVSRLRHALWLRNHDELDLEQLSPEEREEVISVFAPDPDMRAYGRGIRRRLAPMLDGDPARLAMVHALLMSFPGTPVLRYGDEIGMGDDLSLPERLAVRTPMQWTAGRHGGFSSADADQLVAPPIAEGAFGYQKINVESQAWRSDSLLSRIQKMVQARLALPEMGGGWRPARFDEPRVLGMRYDDEQTGASLLAFANLSRDAVAFGVDETDVAPVIDVLCDAPYAAPSLDSLEINGYGYRWVRRRQG